MPQSYGFIFISARDFCEKLQEKFGPHVLSGKNLRHLRYLRDNEQVTQMTQISQIFAAHEITWRFTRKGLYATMNRWHIDSWLYDDWQERNFTIEVFRKRMEREVREVGRLMHLRQGDTILNMVTYVAVVGYSQDGAVPIFLGDWHHISRVRLLCPHLSVPHF